MHVRMRAAATARAVWSLRSRSLKRRDFMRGRHVRGGGVNLCGDGGWGVDEGLGGEGGGEEGGGGEDDAALEEGAEAVEGRG